MLRMRRRANPSREESGKRAKLHFVALEFTGEHEADVYAALADLKVPEGCKMMSVDEDLFCALTDAVGISCSKKARLLRLVSTMLHVVNVIKDRATTMVDSSLAVLRERCDLAESRFGWRTDQLRHLNRYSLRAEDSAGVVFSTGPGLLFNYLDEIYPENDKEAAQ